MLRLLDKIHAWCLYPEYIHFVVSCLLLMNHPGVLTDKPTIPQCMSRIFPKAFLCSAVPRLVLSQSLKRTWYLVIYIPLSLRLPSPRHNFYIWVMLHLSKYIQPCQSFVHWLIYFSMNVQMITHPFLCRVKYFSLLMLGFIKASVSLILLACLKWT